MAQADTTRAPAKADDDWAIQTADTIEKLVETVRSNTSDRLVSIARLVVFGLVAATMGMALLVFLTVGTVRFVNSYLPGDVWAAHLLVGGLFTLLGLLLWRKAWQRPVSR